MSTLIRLDDVHKTFTVYRKAGRVRRRRTEVRAVDGVTLDIEAGTMVGYIGRDPSRHRVDGARRIGVVFGQRTQLWWDLPLADSFDLLRHVYRVPAGDHRTRLAHLTDLLDVGPFLATPVRQLSLGQRMRGELVASLLHDPPILFLDEPTIGLDIVSKETVRRFLGELNRERGTTVLLTTHDLVDVERLCDRLLIIDHGKVIADGTIESIKDGQGALEDVVRRIYLDGAVRARAE